jgi:hypothetical protein
MSMDSIATTASRLTASGKTGAGHLLGDLRSDGDVQIRLTLSLQETFSVFTSFYGSERIATPGDGL